MGLKGGGFLLLALCVGLSYEICHNGICDEDRCTSDDQCPSCFTCDTACGTCKTNPNCCMSHQVEDWKYLTFTTYHYIGILRFALTGMESAMLNKTRPPATTAQMTIYAHQVLHEMDNI